MAGLLDYRLYRLYSPFFNLSVVGARYYKPWLWSILRTGDRGMPFLLPVRGQHCRRVGTWMCSMETGTVSLLCSLQS